MNAEKYWKSLLDTYVIEEAKEIANDYMSKLLDEIDHNWDMDKNQFILDLCRLISPTW